MLESLMKTVSAAEAIVVGSKTQYEMGKRA